MISLRDVSIRQGELNLSDINFEVPRGQYAILMGETGCGKTTLLETICGLRSLSGGSIVLDGLDITRLSPASRQIGYVPQDGVLFPSMKVERQIGFGLEVRKVDHKTRKQRVHELAELLSIQSILNRYPNRLSGGERQRVALARAIAFRPKLLCLDEPLSALDERTHGQILALLTQIHQSEPITILHITHNQSEAKSLGTIHFKFDKSTLVRLNEEPAP